MLGNSDSFVSIPLANDSVYSGSIASVSGNVITLAGTPGLGSLSTAANPHVCVISTGAREGLTALITANTAGTVTISVQTGDDLTGVVAGNKVILQKAWTISKLFQTVTPPAGTQLLAFAGVTPGVNLAPDLIYEWDGTNWIDTNSFDVADNTVLFPAESFVIRNNSGTPLPSIVLTGTVPTYKHRSVLAHNSASQDIPFAHISPVGEIIGQSGLSALCTSGDQLLVFDNNAATQNKSASQIIEFDGTAWINTDSFDDVTTTFSLTPGVGFILRRTGATTVLSDLPTYVTP